MPPRSAGLSGVGRWPTCSSSKDASGIRRGVNDRVMFEPIMDSRTLRGVGPWIAEHMLDSMPLIPFSAYEDMRLKSP